jgi:hypothetical protein
MPKLNIKSVEELFNMKSQDDLDEYMDTTYSKAAVFNALEDNPVRITIFDQLILSVDDVAAIITEDNGE